MRDVVVYTTCVGRDGTVGEWDEGDVEVVIQVPGVTSQYADVLHQVAVQIGAIVNEHVRPAKRGLCAARLMRHFSIEATNDRRLTFTTRPNGDTRAAFGA